MQKYKNSYRIINDIFNFLFEKNEIEIQRFDKNFVLKYSIPNFFFFLRVTISLGDRQRCHSFKVFDEKITRDTMLSS